MILLEHWPSDTVGVDDWVHLDADIERHEGQGQESIRALSSEAACHRAGGHHPAW